MLAVEDSGPMKLKWDFLGIGMYTSRYLCLTWFDCGTLVWAGLGFLRCSGCREGRIKEGVREEVDSY